jgi:hypothetical protein
MCLNMKARLNYEVIIKVRHKVYEQAYGPLAKNLSNQIRFNFESIVNDYVCSPIDDVVIKEIVNPLHNHAPKIFDI